MKKFKILLLNLGYCTELNGSLFDYLTKFYRYPFLPKKIENRVLEKLKLLIKEENPDLVCIPEIKQGKQITSLSNEEYTFVNVATKYGKKNILRKIKVFENKGNAMISKENLDFKKHYLKNGTKKLLLEATLPNGTRIFLMHFSLNKSIRAKQFKELYQQFSDFKSKIICGDFNIFEGTAELDDLSTKSQLKLSSQEATFPAFKPKKSLDLFLISNNLKTKTKVLKNQLSDHLPVVIEIGL